MKSWQQWLIGAGLVVVAWGVAGITPPEDAREAPFAVAAEVGAPATGRNIEITVTELRRASTVTTSDWSADGNWLIVDLSASAVVTDQGAALRTVELAIDGRTFSASERPDSLFKESLNAGIARTGSVAFELPADLDAGTGILTFGLFTDARLDSVIELSVDLTDVAVQQEVALAATDWADG